MVVLFAKIEGDPLNTQHAQNAHNTDPFKPRTEEEEEEEQEEEEEEEEEEVVVVVVRAVVVITRENRVGTAQHATRAKSTQGTDR